jgi:hypothetical protein
MAIIQTLEEMEVEMWVDARKTFSFINSSVWYSSAFVDKLIPPHVVLSTLEHRCT